MTNNRVQAIKQADKTHQETVIKTLQHRLEVARDKGDGDLLRQLEAEMSYYR
ncbi:hypothetical protein H6F32_08695 [Anabaena sp. FACHB-1237]|uniref:arginine synthesis PII-interacting regulator PirA n=1 Tax=Anabaena sp. FACHB-1237 TaxID=2692769 RepID=UPI0016804AC3|nr:hypothetical protein [Anabaena sp. FACHB-1237]MBD2137661.1 hypothetical protein [Anabaena sp. FACHB-1237]